MSKQYKAGGEVDAWCTKCLLMLNHRIIAVGADGVPVKVECQTCDGVHIFRAHAPGTKPSAVQGVRTRAASSSSASTSAPKGAPRGRASAAAREEAEAKSAAANLRLWESSVSGHHPTEFRAYGIREVFAANELMRHSKFGDGVVLEVIDRQKIRVLFRDEPRVLAHGVS
jgi:hypothetical protein